MPSSSFRTFCLFAGDDDDDGIPRTCVSRSAKTQPVMTTRSFLRALVLLCGWCWWGRSSSRNNSDSGFLTATARGEAEAAAPAISLRESGKRREKLANKKKNNRRLGGGDGDGTGSRTLSVDDYVFSEYAGEERPQHMTVLQLGDSFSAGNGAGAYEGVEGCYRSSSNWGNLFVAQLKTKFANANARKDLENVAYANRACSGGVLRHLTEPREMDKWIKWRGRCPDPTYPDEEYFVDDELFRCTRFLRPQLDAVGPQVDLVLLTIGGNDASFAPIVRDCFALGFRDPTSCRSAVETAADYVRSSYKDDLVRALGQIGAKLGPDSKILLASYPHVSLDVEYLLKSGAINYDAARAVRQLNQLANIEQERAVAEANGAGPVAFSAVEDDGGRGYVQISGGENNSSNATNASEGGADFQGRAKDFVLHYRDNTRNFAGKEPHPAWEELNPNRWIFEFEGLVPAVRIVAFRFCWNVGPTD